ncbi:hypothetical protein BJ878DRAFT_1200 [Calycina marina]|uniref:Uncharacterized protein n=1 Tax=Calycina marina TaxID=1763456 RepID=A0A9P7ZBS5_9HELO|nr:hypothetical protein BJ878DRAFT_1200 [Calycina marina]
MIGYQEAKYFCQDCITGYQKTQPGLARVRHATKRKFTDSANKLASTKFHLTIPADSPSRYLNINPRIASRFIYLSNSLSVGVGLSYSGSSRPDLAPFLCSLDCIRKPETTELLEFAFDQLKYAAGQPEKAARFKAVGEAALARQRWRLSLHHLEIFKTKLSIAMELQHHQIQTANTICACDKSTSLKSERATAVPPTAPTLSHSRNLFPCQSSRIKLLRGRWRPWLKIKVLKRWFFQSP